MRFANRRVPQDVALVVQPLERLAAVARHVGLGHFVEHHLRVHFLLDAFLLRELLPLGLLSFRRHRVEPREQQHRLGQLHVVLRLVEVVDLQVQLLRVSLGVDGVPHLEQLGEYLPVVLDGDFVQRRFSLFGDFREVHVVC